MTARASKKQQELLQFIDNFIKGNGYGPSYREIMRGLDYKSVSTVAVHVDGLLARGYLRKKDRSARSLEIVSLSQEQASPAGQPTVSHGAWLKQEIRKHLNGEGKDLTAAETLLQAAEILEVTALDKLRAQLTDQAE